MNGSPAGARLAARTDGPLDRRAGGGVVEVRPPRPHEVDAWAGCVEVAFGVRLGAAERELLIAGLDPRCLAAFEGGELVGTLGAYEVELSLPGAAATRALVLEDVAVLPTHRRRGVLSALLGEALERARRDGPALVVLQASQGGIYGHYGFAPAVLSARYRIARPAVLAVPPQLAAPIAAGSVRLLSAFEALEVLPLVQDEARRARPGEVARRVSDWAELVSGHGGSSSPLRCCAAFESGGRFDGYAVYDLVERGGPARRLAVQLVDLAATTPVAYAALWAYLLDLEPADEVTTGERPLDEPLRHLLADPRALEVLAVTDRSWLRLVDVRAALAARRYGSSGRLVLELADDLCPWNAGRYELEVAGAAGGPASSAGPAGPAGPAAVSGPSTGPRRSRGADPHAGRDSDSGSGSRSDADADADADTDADAAEAVLELDVAALAAAYLGGSSFAALHSAGWVRERSPGAVRRADSLFAPGLAPACAAEL